MRGSGGDASTTNILSLLNKQVHKHFLPFSFPLSLLFLWAAAMEVCWQIQTPTSLGPGFQQKGRLKINTFIGFLPRPISSVSLLYISTTVRCSLDSTFFWGIEVQSVLLFALFD